MERSDLRKRRHTTSSSLLLSEPSNRRRRLNNLPSSFSPITPFVPHLTTKEAAELKVDDSIDHRDFEGRFIMATIEDIQGTKCLIHYEGWSRKYDTWCDREQQLHRFAKAGSISRRRAQRLQHLQIGDHVDINAMYLSPGWTGWTVGRIERKDGHSDQVGVRFNGDKSWWTHLDNTEEIDIFGVKTSGSTERMHHFDDDQKREEP